MSAVLTAWPASLSGKPRTTAEILAAAKAGGDTSDFAGAVVDLIGVDLSDNSAAVRLGRRLGLFRDRRLDGRWITSTKVKNQSRWILKTDTPDPAESGEQAPF